MSVYLYINIYKCHLKPLKKRRNTIMIPKQREIKTCNFKTEFFKNIETDFLARMRQYCVQHTGSCLNFWRICTTAVRQIQKVRSSGKNTGASKFCRKIYPTVYIAMHPGRSDIELIRIIADSGTDIKYMFQIRPSEKYRQEIKSFRYSLLYPPSDAASICFRDNLFPKSAFPSGYERISRLILGEWEIW